MNKQISKTLYDQAYQYCPDVIIKDTKHKLSVQVPMIMLFDYEPIKNLRTVPHKALQVIDFKNGRAIYEVHTNDLTKEIIEKLDKEVKGNK